MGDSRSGPRRTLEAEEDPRWGHSCIGYNVQIPVVGNAAQAFGAAQAHLLALFGAMIRPIPAQALHISIYSVIPVDWECAEKEAVWQRLSTRVHALLTRCCERASPFVLTFEQVRVTPHAVIAVALESNTLIEGCAMIWMRSSHLVAFHAVLTRSSTARSPASRGHGRCLRIS